MRINEAVHFICAIVIFAITIALVSKNKQLENTILKQQERIIRVENQRDLLSDAIRNINDLYVDNECLLIAAEYVSIDSCDIDSIYSWSYCY